MERYDIELLKNDVMINKCISDHLKIDDPLKQQAMEKLFIYNLLN
ncbi:MAG: hypothetical protein ACC608_05875 [Anaerofustis sp.]